MTSLEHTAIRSSSPKVGCVIRKQPMTHAGVSYKFQILFEVTLTRKVRRKICKGRAGGGEGRELYQGKLFSYTDYVSRSFTWISAFFTLALPLWPPPLISSASYVHDHTSEVKERERESPDTYIASRKKIYLVKIAVKGAYMEHFHTKQSSLKGLAGKTGFVSCLCLMYMP